MKRLTMSGLSRAEACAGHLHLPHFDRASDKATDAGTAVHRYLEVLASGVEPKAALELVEPQHRALCAAIDPEQLPHTQGGWEAEVPYAIDVESGVAWRLPEACCGRAYDADPRLRDAPITTVPGTLDLVRIADGEAFVIDVKTGGRHLPAPSEAPQLLAAALAVTQAHRLNRVTVGWLFVREGEEPRLWVEQLTAFDLDAASERLAAIVRKAIEGEGTHRTGDHCSYCPAWRVCPANLSLVKAAVQAADADALGLALADGLPVVREEALPLLAQRIAAAQKVLEQLDGMVRDAAKAVGHPITHPLDPSLELCEVTTQKSTLDPELAAPVLDLAFGVGAADEAVEVSKTLTKAALERLARAKAAVTGEKQTHIVRGVTEALRAAGAVKEFSYVAWKLRKKKD